MQREQQPKHKEGEEESDYAKDQVMGARIENIGITVAGILLFGYSALLQQMVAAHPVQTLNMTCNF